MEKILVLSVGGSPEPLVNAIKINKPDFVYFFCSSGKKGSATMVEVDGGTVQKGLANQAGLEKTQYEIVTVDDPDDLNNCFFVLKDLASRIHNKHTKDHQVLANYTGGTKTMSVAMALTGLTTQKWHLSLSIGQRFDLIKVRAGDVPVIIDKWEIFCSMQIGFVKKTIERFDYEHAKRQIENMLEYPLESKLKKRLINARSICLAFDKWDKFNHSEALELLASHGNLSRYIIVLKKILGKTKSTGYEIVGDILNNAERKACRGQYDDAVARLYRAIELFAQVRLRQEYNFSSGELTLNDLPEELKDEYKAYARTNGVLILGLREDYLLLNRLNDNIGQEFKNIENRIISALTLRNNSICAHGLTPLNSDDFDYVNSILRDFIIKVTNTNGIIFDVPQFPKEIDLQ